MNFEKLLSILNEREQELLILFDEWLGTNLKERTKNHYFDYFLLMKKESGIIDISQDDVIRFVNKHYSKPARAFIKNYLAFRKLRDIEIPKKRGTTEKRIVHIPTPDERQMILDVLYKKKYEMGLLFETIDLCALRISEGINIQKRDFNFTKWNTDLKIFENAPCELRIKGKGNKYRIVIVPLELSVKHYLFFKDKEDNRYLIEHEDNYISREETRQKVGQMFNYVVKKLGYIEYINNMPVNKYHPHTLRHFRATEWYKEDKDLMNLKTRLGHADISTTQMYINTNEEDVIDNWKAKEILKNKTG